MCKILSQINVNNKRILNTIKLACNKYKAYNFAEFFLKKQMSLKKYVKGILSTVDDVSHQTRTHNYTNTCHLSPLSSTL